MEEVEKQEIAVCLTYVSEIVVNVLSFVFSLFQILCASCIYSSLPLESCYCNVKFSIIDVMYRYH